MSKKPWTRLLRTAEAKGTSEVEGRGRFNRAFFAHHRWAERIIFAKDKTPLAAVYFHPDAIHRIETIALFRALQDEMLYRNEREGGEVSTKSAEVSSKLVGPFRAEDFGTDDPCEVLRLGMQENRAAVQLANALLAPLWEALERLDIRIDINEEEGEDDMLEDAHTEVRAVLAAFRALRDREGK